MERIADVKDFDINRLEEVQKATKELPKAAHNIAVETIRIVDNPNNNFTSQQRRDIRDIFKVTSEMDPWSVYALMPISIYGY